MVQIPNFNNSVQCTMWVREFYFDFAVPKTYIITSAFAKKL